MESPIPALRVPPGLFDHGPSYLEPESEPSPQSPLPCRPCESPRLSSKRIELDFPETGTLRRDPVEKLGQAFGPEGSRQQHPVPRLSVGQLDLEGPKGPPDPLHQGLGRRLGGMQPEPGGRHHEPSPFCCPAGRPSHPKRPCQDRSLSGETPRGRALQDHLGQNLPERAWNSPHPNPKCLQGGTG